MPARIVGVIAAALAATAVIAAGSPAQDVPVRDCRSRAEPTRGHIAFERTDVIAGPVAFASLRIADPRLIARHDGFFSRKVALKVRAGRAVNLVVPARWRDRLWLAYTRGSFDDESVRESEVRFQPCPPSTASFRGGTVGAITGFNGGFVFTRKGCYAVEVHVEGRARPLRARLPLGAPCR